ncbi:IS1-like element transposase, partial [Escherichia coli]|uniref:IS1-like element transposase n=1 Tax=Escherichia coli TaxID=562 RepID=UPI003EBEDF05
AGHQRYLCSHCRKTWQLQFTYTASQPGTPQKIIDMAMNGVGCRATARIMGVGLNTIFRHLHTSDRHRYPLPSPPPQHLPPARPRNNM